MDFVLFGQGDDFSLPLELLKPQHGESLRFPRDYWIGELGRGEAAEDAYQTAQRILGRLIRGNSEDAPEHVKRSLSVFEGLELRSFRLGGGRNEADGSVSFLVRFLGREEAVAGELYLRRPVPEDGGEPVQAGEWRLDDLILDKKRPLTEGIYSSGGADMTLYERFF